MRAALRNIASVSLRDVANATRRMTRALGHRGTRLACPLCGRSFGNFLPYGLDTPVLAEKEVVGAGRRSDCLCPFCRATDRDRLVYLYLEKHSSVFSDPVRLLHVAPEPALSQRLRRNANIAYVSGDLGSPLADIELDVTALPFRDQWFDWVICNHVLEHVPDEASALREIRRVLRPGGKALLQVPWSSTLDRTDESPAATPAERLSRFGQQDHVRLYGLDYPDRVAACGFSVERFHYAEAHGRDEARRYALPEREMLFVFSAQ